MRSGKSKMWLGALADLKTELTHFSSIRKEVKVLWPAVKLADYANFTTLVRGARF